MGKLPRDDRRRHVRVDLRCPITLCDQAGNVIHKTHTANVSDGGAFLTIPLELLPSLGLELHVSLALPRSTPNTYMLEDVQCPAKVIRQQPLKETTQAGMAVQFAQPQRLMLTV